MLARNPQLPESLALESFQAFRRKNPGAIDLGSARGKLVLSNISGPCGPILLFTCQGKKIHQPCAPPPFALRRRPLITEVSLASSARRSKGLALRNPHRRLGMLALWTALPDGDMYC
jgi:hypothetical protein